MINQKGDKFKNIKIYWVGLAVSCYWHSSATLLLSYVRNMYVIMLLYRWFRSRPSGSSHSCRPMQTLLWVLQKPLPSQPVLARPEHFSIVLLHGKVSSLTPWPAHQTSPCRHCPGRCCRAPVPGWAIGRRGSYHPALPACNAIMELVRCVWHLSYFATGLLLENCVAKKILCF